MENTSSKPKKQGGLFSKFAFAMGNMGHAAFYAALSNYFIIFVTSGLFVGLPKNIANKLIVLITTLIVIIRVAEIMIDPVLGNIVDNTRTKWGKFKPWIRSGTIVSSVLLVVLFTGIFGLAEKNWILFAILFVILFVILDVFYSFSDVSYWGMVPALSEDSDERGVYTALGNFTGSIGWNGLTIIVVPIVTWFTFAATGKHTEGPQGWVAFSVIISALTIICMAITAFGTQEKDNVIRRASQNEKTTLRGVFTAIVKNDQILWASLAYFLYSLANVVTNGVLFYYFKFILDRSAEYAIVGVVATIVGFCTSPLYPILNKFIPRKVLFCLGQACMIVSYLIFIFFGSNMTLLVIGLALYNFTFAQLVTVLTLTDAIEYGQLKNGERNEAVTLSIRPMIDKLTGAFSNGLVSFIAITCGMTGAATAADMTAGNVHTFKSFAFYIPLVLAILALFVFVSKVKLTEKKHAEIVEELQRKLSEGQNDSDKTEEYAKNTGMTNLVAPVSGKIMDVEEMPKVLSEFNGRGFAIRPQEGKIYAPFDGVVRFTFTTRHVIGLVSENGLEMIIHIGIGTVNMRGQGFISHYVDGQKVKAGELLMDFDRDLIVQNGYDDIVVCFFTQPGRIKEIPSVSSGEIVHGEKIADVEVNK